MCNVLIPAFLNLKRRSGSVYEKRIYANISAAAFLDRLLTKRPVVFFTDRDQYMLRLPRSHAHATGSGGFDDLEIDGTSKKNPYITLDEYIGYDEMAICKIPRT